MEDQNEVRLESSSSNRVYVRVFLLALFVFVFYLSFRIFQPFLGAIALALVLASLVHPAHRRILALFRGRANLAALTSCVLLTLLVLLPVLFLILALASQVGQVYIRAEQWVQTGEFDRFIREQGGPALRNLTGVVEQYIGLQNLDVASGLASGLKTVSVFLLQNSTAILGGFVNLVGQFCLMLVTLFFMLRDGSRLWREVRSLTALSDRYEQALAAKFREVTQATVLGSLATAVSQGVVGGLVFWFLGVEHALFWGSLIGLFSLVPVVGAAVIWVPWAAFLIATGATARGIILALCCIFLVGMLDNIVRPLFIEGKSGMHTVVVFFSLMGGVAWFGMIGLIFGPILVSVFLTLVEIYRIEFRLELYKPE